MTETEMLIDRYLPRFDVTLIEHTVIAADVATTWTTLHDFDLMRIHTPLVDAAMLLRGIPARVGAWSGRTRPDATPPAQLKLIGDGPTLEGWLALGQIAEHEVAFGAVGRIAANFSLRTYGRPRTLASYEARTATSDPDSARRFARYWWLVRPIIGHIMRAALAGLRQDAQLRAGRATRGA